MNSRQVVRLVALALAAAFTFTPLAALAGAPPQGGRHAELSHRCKGGPKKGEVCDANAANQSCLNDGECPVDQGCYLKTGQCSECGNNECAFEFPGKTRSAVLTVVMDDHVGDPGDDTNVTLHALTVMLEVGSGSAKRILAETYANAQFDDINMGIWNAAIVENALVFESPDSFLFQIPNGTLAESLRQFFGETGVPLIVATGKASVSDNQGTLSCQGPAVPYQCCLGGGSGSCDGRNAQCVAFGDPFSCCLGFGNGTCDIEQIASTYRMKVKLRFATP